jgi:putative hydrolase of HD superfamily
MAKKTVTTDISKTIEFVLEVDKLKGVLRKVRPISEERFENTAEHSWQIALFAMSISRTLGLKVDVTRAVAMLLVHDLGEIDAGDKFVFAQDGWEERKAAELKALERICGPGTQDNRRLPVGDYGKSSTREKRMKLALPGLSIAACPSS